VDRQGYSLTLEDVPAWICRQCGEAYYEPQEVERIQDVIRAIDTRTEMICG